MSHLDPRREYDVTASDIPSICGECPYASRRSVLFKKSLKLRSPDTAATLHGKQYEPIAIQKFIEKTGAKVELSGGDAQYKKHSVYTWLGGTVDGIATYPDGRRLILEVKCPISRQIKGDCIPIHYIGQVQTYMFLYDMDCCAFVQYRPPRPRTPEQLQITYIDRDVKVSFH
jgi:putative phage-type endonuclease